METDEIGERLFASALGCLDILSIHVGDRLGLYQALRSAPRTNGELADAADIHPRYAREWLEQQCVSGLLTVDDPTLPPHARRYELPPEHVPLLADPDDLAGFAPFARLLATAAVQLPALLAAYRTGGGVAWADFGPEMRSAQADANRPLYLRELAQKWMPAIPEVEKLLREGGSVADLGCGEGWSSIALALAYPEATIDGYDTDPASVEAARSHASSYEFSGRLTFHLVDVADAIASQAHDLVVAFECIHDMPDPVSVLSAARRMLAEHGTMVVMDERVPDRFTGPGDPIEQLMYGFSMFVCLPDSMSHDSSVATGTVMRRSTLESYATAAGFGSVDVLPIEHEMFRFYRLS